MAHLRRRAKSPENMKDKIESKNETKSNKEINIMKKTYKKE
jgi:hypothetical protein